MSLSDSRSILVLREDDLKTLLDVPTALDVIEKTWADYGKGNAYSLSQPTSMFAGSGLDGRAKYKVKGATLATKNVTGFRLVGDLPLEHGFASYHTLCVFDDFTGAPIGLLDELWLHRFRTAITGVVAARHLARADAKTVGLIGAGAIAREMFPALEHVLAIDEVRVAARRFESAKSYCEDMSKCAASRFIPVETAEQAADGADIVFTLTFAESPVIRTGMMAPGSFLCSMGETEEVDLAVLDEMDRFVVDEFEYATVLGDISIWLKEGKVTREALASRVSANIGEVVTGQKAGRSNSDERIFAIIQGMAVCDLALAETAMQKAREEGIGDELTLF